MLTLKLLGGLSMEAQAELGAAATQRRPLALLAAVAATGGRGLSREHAFLLFWPESNARGARSTLNQTLYALRRDLREPDLFIRGTTLRLNPTVVKCDHWAFEQALSRRELEQAVSQYGGPFLDHFSLPGVPEFERWVAMERSRLFERYFQATISLAERTGERGERKQAIKWWRQLSGQDPYSGVVAKGLITALAADGDRSGALRYAQEYGARLKIELDTEIDPKVKEIIRRVASADKEHIPTLTARQVTQALDGDTAEEALAMPIHRSTSEVAPATKLGLKPSDRNALSAQGFSYQDIVESLVDVAYITNVTGEFTYTNSAGSKLLALPPDRIVGRSFIDFVREDYRHLLVDYYARQIQQRTAVTFFEFPVVRETGETFWLAQHVQIIERNGEPVGMLAIARDITLPRALQGSQAFHSVTDRVTKLLNDAAFGVIVDNRIALSERSQQGFMLVFVRVENLEEILLKDGVPHTEKLLNHIADALRESFRKSDVLARIRPDKFAVLAMYASEVDSETLEKRVRENLKTHTSLETGGPQPSIIVRAAFYDPAMPQSLESFF